MTRVHLLRHASRALAALAVLGALALPAPTQAQGTLSPFGIARGPDGNVWFTEATGNAIGRITPSGKVTTFHLPMPNRGPQLITARPDGNLWLGDIQANVIKMIKPDGTDGLPSDYNVTNPFGITVGPDGNIWFVAPSNNAIGRITLKTGAQQAFPLPTAGSNPALITAGADGNLWFTEVATDTIGRITTTGKVTEFPV